MIIINKIIFSIHAWYIQYIYNVGGKLQIKSRKRTHQKVYKN